MSGAKRIGWALLGLLLGALLALALGGATGAKAAGHVGHAGPAHVASGRAAATTSAPGRTTPAPLAQAGGVNPVRGAAARIGTVLRAAGTPQNPGRLLVTATEFRLALSRPSVNRGVVVVELLVAGEDPHDLALRRLDRRGRPTGRTLRIPRVTPDALGEGEFRLAAGAWQLTCTLPGHARMGMKATLRVR